MKKVFTAFVLLMYACTSYAAYYDEGNDGNNWDSAYIIDSLEDLELMRARIRQSFDVPGKYYKLDADIDTTAAKSRINISSFAGHFDGQGHTLTVNSTMFFRVNMPSSRDVAIKNLNVIGTVENSYSGGIVSKLESGVIDNCKFSGSVSANMAGGIAGTVEDGVIRRCKVNGSVHGVNWAGGIVASLKGSGGIEDCEAMQGSEVVVSGDIIGGYAGGIVGWMKGGYVTGCTSHAKLNATKSEGGIVGKITTTTNRSRITGNYYTEIDREVGSGTGIFDPDPDPDPEPELDPDLDQNPEPEPEPDLDQNPEPEPEPDPDPDQNLDPEPEPENPTPSQGAYYDEGNNGNSWATAYIIDSLEDIELMRARISRGYDVAGKYYKLAIDIDLSSSKSWLISSTFAGHFDGQGHTITVDPNKGIFRYVNTPSSRDIAIINLNVKTPSTQDVMSSGYSIVYRLLSGVIENCTFTGNVSSDAAGGIAYRVDDGFIRNCSFSGTVQADSYAGGIVARLAGEGGIENCKVGSEVKVSISKIASAKYAGGIVGRMTGGYVKGCTSYAKITGTDGIGGIVGCISKAVNRSRITGNTYTGVDREVGYGTGYFDPDQDPNPTPEYDPDSRDNNLQPQDNTQHDGGGGGGCTSITLSGFSLLLLAGLVLQKSRRH